MVYSRLMGRAKKTSRWMLFLLCEWKLRIDTLCMCFLKERGRRIEEEEWKVRLEEGRTGSLP